MVIRSYFEFFHVFFFLSITCDKADFIQFVRSGIFSLNVWYVLYNAMNYTIVPTQSRLYSTSAELLVTGPGIFEL